MSAPSRNRWPKLIPVLLAAAILCPSALNAHSLA